MSPRKLVLAALSVFVLGVVALTIGGKPFLHDLEQADATISYLDLARQATLHRQYELADEYYQQAITYAARTTKPRENEVVALDEYSKFFRIKRNPLKDVKRADELRDRALAISQGMH